MFAKLARLSQLRCLLPSAARPDTPGSCRQTTMRLTPVAQARCNGSGRPVLVCHWRRAPADGRLECRWRLQAPDEGAGGAHGEDFAQSQR